MISAEKVERIARVCHEANRGLQAAEANPANTVAPAWDDTTEEMRDSARQGVAQALAGATPEALHEAWCVEKNARGWHYGPVKDAEKREHPCLVAYRDLPDGEREKDAVFSAIVAALA